MTSRTSLTSSPPSKRIKLESTSPPQSPSGANGHLSREEEDLGDSEYDEEDTEEDYERCSICLQSYVDRTVVPTCSHEFCFECVLVWTEQSRRCPLCSQNIGDHLIHHIRSKYDFQKHFLPPLPTSPRPQTLLPLPARRRAQFRGNGRRREARWGRDERREREQERIAVDEFERAVEKRKWVYRHRLYAKHVASNPYTRYKPCPTPAQFSASQDLITRATIFVRRELRVWGCLDVEFLTTFTVSLLKSIDIRSEPAVKLLSEFLDLDSEHELQVVSRNDSPRANAEHFAHGEHVSSNIRAVQRCAGYTVLITRL